MYGATLRALAALLVAVFAVAACGGHRPAPVQFKGSSVTPVRSGAFGTGPQIIGVRHGDTIYAVSRRTGVTVRTIIDHNRLRPPYRLKPGQRLKIPGPFIHVVRKGETVYSISRDHGVDMASLVRANYIRRPYKIDVSQRLVIPGRIAGSARPVSKVRTASKSKIKGKAKKPLPAPPKRTGRQFSWPVKGGKVISRFGPKAGGLHNDGINIAIKKGSPVRAAESGVVAYAGNELRGFGNLLLVRHAGGWVTAYAHNSKLLVKRGERITRNQVIAKSGASGSVKIPQIHFEIRKGTEAVNPQWHLSGRILTGGRKYAGSISGSRPTRRINPG